MPQFRILTLGQFSVSLINISVLVSKGDEKNVKGKKHKLAALWPRRQLHKILHVCIPAVSALNGKCVLLHSSSYHYQTIIVYWIIAHYCPPNSLIYFTKK